MDYKQINELLEKYWQGESSLDDENALHQYFESDQIAKEHQSFKPLFSFFKKEAEISLDESFDKKIQARLSQESKSKPVSRVFRLPQLARIAAVLLIGIGIGYFAFQQGKSDAGKEKVASQGIDWSKYEVTDEEEAIKQVELALRLISNNVNKGTSVASKSVGKMEKATKIIAPQ